MKLIELIEKYTWEDIQAAFPVYDPAPDKILRKYKEAFNKLQNMQAIPSDMNIFLDEEREIDERTGKPYIDERTGRIWVYVFAKNGKRRKEYLSHVAIQKLGDEFSQQEIEYDLSYEDWDVILGMAIDPTTIEKYSEVEIILRCLTTMAHYWHSEEEYEDVMEEVKAIKAGISKDPIIKKEKQFTNLYQIWHELSNGTFHGIYTTYWGIGPDKMQIQGIVVNGRQEGIWTYWDQQGEINQQVRFICDRPVEVRKEPPWWQENEQ